MYIYTIYIILLYYIMILHIGMDQAFLDTGMEPWSNPFEPPNASDHIRGKSHTEWSQLPLPSEWFRSLLSQSGAIGKEATYLCIGSGMGL